jgi:hypothetical protein
MDIQLSISEDKSSVNYQVYKHYDRVHIVNSRKSETYITILGFKHCKVKLSIKKEYRLTPV